MTQVVAAPVGLWAGTVFYGNAVEPFTVELDAEGSAELRTHETRGHGTWHWVEDGSFAFTITETLNEGDSGVSGETEVTGIDHLVINITAKLSGTSFDGVGKAEVFDADGNIIFSIDAETKAYLSGAAA
jgi:hypothetical protein